ncbi:MAG: TonB-dependent receptor [Sandarakinorhabdus sp.]|nr:TonB-dependent receptor [Sandarakinorhabdus sp.]
MRHLRIGCAIAALIAPVAIHAQSTGSQQLEEVIIVTAGKQKSGVFVAETAAKSRSTIGQDFIEKKQAGQSILQTLNLTPGYNFVNNDPYGNSGGNVRIRGFDGQRISLTQDGIPLNDTGNYAIFSNQQLDPELIERATVNTGTTDVDSPTASAAGGVINYVTRKPAEDFGLMMQGSYGSFDYKRVIGILDTGKFGPWGTSAWLSASYTDYDKFKGPGNLRKFQANFRVFQPIGSGDDFISVIGHFNRNRNNFYRNLRLSEFNLNPDIDRLSTCIRPIPGAGVQDERNPSGTTVPVAGNSGANNAACGGTTIGVDSGYYNLFINPSDTGNLRAQARFSLTDTLRLTLDPSYQYTLANGGGSEVVAETDPRLQGFNFLPATAQSRVSRGIDLNGDGDIVDFVRLYRPNNTNTNRFGLNASLIWNVTDDQTLRVAYAFDRGRHRQTGEFSPLDQNGDPYNVFGGNKGPAVLTLDGKLLQNRDRLSIAILNQFSAEYRGRFFDDKLDVAVGVRAPFFKRELNQYCFTIAGSNTTPGVAVPSGSGFAYCTGQTEAQIAATPGSPGVGTTGNQLRRPFQAEVKYDAVLPNVGISFKPWDGHQVFASYAESLSAPRTDDLYDIQLPTVQPERTKAIDLGYRYTSSVFQASGSFYYNKFTNRILRAFDQDQGINITRNVGAVDFYGFDGQIGVQPMRGLGLYGTFSWTETEVKSDTQGANATTFIPTKGKKLVDTPRFQYGARVDYTHDWFNVGVDFKHVGDRFATDVNDETAPAYNIVDVNARLRLDRYLQGSWLQLNVNNLFDETYLGNINSVTNAVTIPASGTSSAVNGGFATYSVGAPRSVSVTLRVQL